MVESSWTVARAEGIPGTRCSEAQRWMVVADDPVGAYPRMEIRSDRRPISHPSVPGSRLRGQVSPCLGEHGLAGRDLHSLASFGLAEGLLRGLEPVVALPIGVFDALGLEQLDDRIRVFIHRTGQRARGLVVEDVADRLQR